MHQKTRFPWVGLAVISAILTLLFSANAPAQTPELWGNLLPGPFAVGFGTVEKYDYSRTFRPEKDYFGNRLEGEKARPIQLCYWYPAQTDDSRTRMLYGEYAFPYPNDASFFNLLSNLQNRELGVLFPFMGNNQALVQNSMDIELYGMRDAAPVEGSFPLVLYHGGRRGSYSQNVVMCEYLASHGFIVATTHTIGQANPNVGESGEDFQTVVRDKELALAMARDLPGVNAEKLGLLGFGYGGSTALIHQMRNSGVDAVVTLQADFLAADAFERLTSQTFYDPLSMQAPWFQLFTENPEMPVDLSLLDSLRFAERYDCRFTGLSAQDLTTYRLLAASLTPDSTTTFTATSRGYNTTCDHVLNFLKAYLYDDPAGWAWLESLLEDPDPDFFTCTMIQAEEVPPTQLQFINIIREYGIERAKEVCEKYDLTNPENPIMPTGNFTQLGYQFLQRGNLDAALVMFQWGVTAHPGSANAWDSYGEACAANGQIELALTNYRTARRLLPADSTLPPGFRPILENSITTNIERLEQQLTEPSTEGE